MFSCHKSYCEKWSKLDEDAMPGVLVAVLSEPVDDFSANFNVLATQREDASLTDKSEAIIEMYKTMVTDFDLLAREMGTIADEPCISIKYTCTQGTLELYMFQCILDHEDNTYIITFTASQSNYENYEGTFKEIIDSFSF